MGRRAIQDDEVCSLPRKGWLLASLGLALVCARYWLRGRSSIFLPSIPQDDHGQLRGLSGESVETPMRSTANDDTDRLLRRREWRLFLCGLRGFARHERLIGGDRLPLCR